MDKLNMHSINKVDEHIGQIAALFPNAVTEAIMDGKIVKAIDFDVLRQELSDVLVEGPAERYQFTWPEKRKSILLANAPIAKTLRPIREESVEYDTTDNLYIEGDNLDVLKLLQETYMGKVKMIYIDPPYNTGKDFVYEDDFAQNVGEYLANSAQFDNEGNRLVSNLESNGRFHTDWLNMMYPRLKLAKDMLRDDGVIFISIHDAEYENLKKISDEIFGKVHCLGTIVWKARVKPVNIGEAKYRPQKEIEYVLCYERSDANNKFYPLITGSIRSYPHSINSRKYRIATILKSNRGSNYRSTMSFEIDGYMPSEGQRWQAGNDEIERLFKGGYIEFRDNTPFRRYFEDEEGEVHDPFYCFMENEWSSTSEAGKSELNDLLGEFHGFDTVKPTTLLRTLIMSCTKDNDIILDFFSGSATTAHSVMKLNSEDGMTRRYILVQIPEQCNETNKIDGKIVKNICEIGKERIRRAGKKIKDETGLLAQNLDIGFRVLKVDSTNMQDIYYNPSEYQQLLLDGLTDNIKPNRSSEDLLFQVMLDLGILLSSRIEKKVIGEKNVFSVAEGYLIACFDSEVNADTVTEIAKLKPYYAVFRDSGMANDSVATNFEQIFTTFSPTTVRKVL